MSEPNVKIIANKQFWLNARDFLRGALLTVVTAVLTAIYTSFTAGTFTIDWKVQKQIAMVTFLGYIIKNFLEPSNTLIQVKNDAPQVLAAQMKSAETISIDKTPSEGNASISEVNVSSAPGEKPVVTTSVG